MLNTVPGEANSIINRNLNAKVCKYILDNNFSVDNCPDLFEKYSSYEEKTTLDNLSKIWMFFRKELLFWMTNEFDPKTFIFRKEMYTNIQSIKYETSTI